MKFKQLILVFCFLAMFYSLGAQSNSNFRHLSPSLGNNSINVSKIIQDASGTMWMLCSRGILHFDGYDYILVKNEDLFPKMKKNDQVKTIVKDTDSNIWIVSNFGLISRYNSEKGIYENINENLLKNKLITTISAKKKSIWLVSSNGTLFRYKNKTIDSITTVNDRMISVKNIFNIEIISDHQIYISTNDGKIFNYNLKEKKSSELVGPFSNFPGALILTSDNQNRLWIGTETFGLFVYDLSREQFVQNTLFKGTKFNVDNELFITFFNDSDGNIWAGTDGGGLYKINPMNGNIAVFKNQDSNDHSLSSNTVLNISEDRHKNIWVTTNYGNLNILPRTNEKINYLTGSENNKPVRILSIFKSSSNTLWIGTDGFGLTKIDVSEDGSTKKNAFSKDFYIQSIAEDAKGNIWFGTYKNGLWIYNPKRDSYKKKIIISSKKHEATDVRTVFKDSKGRIWVSSNVSLNIYDSETNVLASFENNSNGLKGTIAETIIEDKNGNFWLGMFRNNLVELKENNSNLQFSSFIEHPNLYSIRSMAITNEGELYLINSDGELLNFNSIENSSTNYEQLAINNEHRFVSVVLQNNKNIWLGSNNGIHHFDLTTKTLKTYDNTDGLQDNIFLVRSVFKDNDGLLYFGGIKGLNYFKPKHLFQKKSNPSLFINTIEILNKPIKSILPKQITTGIPNTKSLELSNEHSSFSFKFSAIDNILNPSFSYAYRLKGFDKNWITNHSERLATYTNIPPGSYTFEVKASTKNDVWDIAPQKIDIKIAYPFWNSTLAYLIYGFFLAGITYSIKRWFTLRKKVFLEKVLHKKENDLYTYKMDFFAKMSHEIQTPLTLISAPLHDMKIRATDDGNLLLKQRLDIISNNAQRLSKIARELTLLRNKELGKLKLAVSENSLCDHMRYITTSFKEMARTKQIDFNINCPKNLQSAWYDKDKIEHIIYNLLSNAFKFTPNNGVVNFDVETIESDRSIKLSISDSGAGIPKTELTKIFELFYQSKSSKKYKGTGIGLALTKELVNLHNGKISVKSKTSKGTTFSLVLPIAEACYDDSVKIITETDHEPKSIVEKEFIETFNPNLNHKTILVVEDHLEIQQLLNELLHNHYNVLLANDGEEGYELAKNKKPDIILSDVMMPKLGGVEMCEKLQKNILTSHIPIILLTAKNSISAKIEGLSSGAIEYLNKPFNTTELLLKINNILSSKEHIISNYRKEVLSFPEINIDKTKDELFLENLVEVINTNIDNTDFKVEDLTDSLKMSYSSLYRKCQTLTGHSLVDFVRVTRLKKAAILLSKYRYSINETAYLTGFNDPKYFSKCFKNQFNMTPGNFKKEARMTSINSFLKNYQLEDAG